MTCDDHSPAEPYGQLVTELTRHARLLHLMKQRFAAALPSGLDTAALGLLMALVRQGPRRQSELAEVTFLDPSTVSRYAAQLVRTGLVSRRPDPVDGRAVQLVATDEGTALAERTAEERRAVFSRMLAAWSEQDAAALVRLLRRLNDEIEAHRAGADPSARSVGV